MMAFTAASSEPSVPFLKPTGVDRPEAISRCVCDSEVRAPMAVQAIRSPRYCGADRIERLGAGRQADFIDGEQEFARLVQAFLDVEGIVHARIVDVALPAGRGARLFEIHAHHQQQRVGDFVGERLQAPGVVEAGHRVVDRAGADDDEQARVAPSRMRSSARRPASTDSAAFGCGTRAWIPPAWAWCRRLRY
jgi:hypothetical protein